MQTWLIGLLIGIGLFIISLFFEEVRDFYSEILANISETFSYIISFEWIGDVGEFFSSMFENISEFSVYGLTFGVLCIMLIYLTRNQMIAPFVQYYSPIGKTFWTILTYVTVFLGGYFLGKHFENT